MDTGSITLIYPNERGNKMSEKENNPQVNENILQKVLKKLPKWETVFEFVGTLDKMMIYYWGVAVALMMYVFGQSYVRFLPTTPEQAVYHADVFSGFVLISLFAVALTLFDSLRRNELGDFVKMLVAIGVCFVAVKTTPDLTIIILAYGFGFSLAHSASRNGKLDWTPIVGFNAAYVAIAASAFGYTAVTIVVPVLMAVAFEVAEVLRFRNYRAIRLAVPGIAVSIVGIVVSMNPTLWILAGGIISFGVVPTIVRLHKDDSDWLRFSEQPCSGWQNGAKHLTVNFESAMLTLVTSLVVTILMLVIG